MNKILKKNSSFTLIELLVVIVIIGVLAGIVAVATSHFISTSHNTKLVGELSNLSKMLQGRTYYPAGNFCIEDDSNEDAKRFRIELGLDKVPRHPQYNDGDTHLTTNNCFLYFSDGDEYSIRLPALGNEGYLIQESRNPAVKPIQKSCDEGWIPFGNRCIMQYEAKKGAGNIATSVATGTPWVSIYQDVAKVECEKIGAHLITNAEWMAIARDIEAQGENWTGDTVGSGVLKMGNVGSNTNDGDAWYALGSADFEGNTKTGTNRGSDSPAKLVLSNGQSIWDFSGNVWEWVDEIRTTTEIQSDFNASSNDWHEYNESNLFKNATSIPYSMAGSAGNFKSSDGIGKIYITKDDAIYGNPPKDLHAFIRGGGWSNGANAGVFALYLRYSPSRSDTGIGFRCAR
jgi:prepilin-type N-terminal cleavage/methylation domain-containing protein